MSQALWAMVNRFHNIGGPDVIGFPPLGIGRKYYVDGANGDDDLAGDRPDRPKLTLGAAFDRCVAGQNDAVVVIGNGVIGGSVLLSSAFAWDKNATHLFGITAPTTTAQRARIASLATAASFTPMITVSADGCMFNNLHFVHEFNSDVDDANETCWRDTGQRNYYGNVHFSGIVSPAAAAGTTARTLHIGSGGNGEHTFYRCTIGNDTRSRGAANATLEFSGATPRSRFIECVFPFQTSAAGVLGIISTTGGMDRWQLFERCVFINNVGSGTTTMAALATIPASPGGILLIKDCTRVDITDLGTDANSLAAIFVDGAPLPVGDDAGKAVVAIAT